MKSLDIGQIAKKYHLTLNEQQLLYKILSFSHYSNSLLNIEAFEGYIQNWLDKNVSIKESDEKLLNSIRNKFNFFDIKTPIFSTKYIKPNQKAFILNNEKIPIFLYKNSEKKLFWSIEKRFIQKFKTGQIITIGFTREDKKFYKFKTKILDIGTVFGITILKTAHSKNIESRRKRLHNRYEVDIDIEIKYKTKDKMISTFQGKIKNISLSGAQIVLKNFNKDLYKNEPISIKIDLDSERFFVDSDIKYIIKKDNLTIFGVEFLNRKKSFEDKLRKLIQNI